jgi:anthranilate phosphoribosyltransferase
VTDCAVLSAGLRLYAAGVAASPSAGSAAARAALESGAAADSLAGFVEATREAMDVPAVAA